tara:strand:+ start:610 stop:774 length:165 start_codon:yes stop_codon:yes gene_type:complete
MSKKIEIERSLIVSISKDYYNLPRKQKKAEQKRVAIEITNALNQYIRVYNLKEK